ncbi:MAG: PilZ domain-containing protein [Spirochaetales bacterium]|nr:PilZ domain-containing protein [Spirochaetales bacterium]
MKTLLVIEHDNLKDQVIEHLAPRGFDFIHYRSPIKALDNIEEIKPDLVIFSAVDFPRHWKPFITLLRSFLSKEKSVFILLKGNQFPSEESTKASALDVNGIISDDFSNPAVLGQLEDIFTRYNVIDDKRISRRYLNYITMDIEFTFIHPLTLSLVNGEITDISIGGLSFKPDSPQNTLDIREGTVLNNCTLRLKDSFNTISVTVIRNNNILSLGFINLEEDLKEELMEYFHEIPERELDRVLHTGDKL